MTDDRRIPFHEADEAWRTHTEAPSALFARLADSGWSEEQIAELAGLPLATIGMLVQLGRREADDTTTTPGDGGNTP